MGEEFFPTRYERGYSAGKRLLHLDKDAPGRFDKSYMQGYSDGAGDAILEGAPKPDWYDDEPWHEVDNLI